MLCGCDACSATFNLDWSTYDYPEKLGCERVVGYSRQLRVLNHNMVSSNALGIHDYVYARYGGCRDSGRRFEFIYATPCQRNRVVASFMSDTFSERSVFCFTCQEIFDLTGWDSHLKVLNGE